MLTADLLPVRRRGATLTLPKLDAARRRRLLPLCEAVIELLASLREQPRGAVEAALASIDVPPTELMLWRGLCKLALDASTFEDPFAVAAGAATAAVTATATATAEGDVDADDAGGPADAVALRAALFAAAAAARRAAGPRRPFDREAIVTATAAAVGLSAEALEARLFSDLAETHLLRTVGDHDPEALLRRYDLGCQQAVLLRALRVEVELHTRDGAALRGLFRWLKFRRLMWRCRRLAPAVAAAPDARAGTVTAHDATAGPGVLLEIDGPAALFAQSTRYGVQLAQLLPVLRPFARWRMRADVVWGRQRTLLTFSVEGGGRASGAAAADAAPSPATAPAEVADEVTRLCADVAAVPGGWAATPCAEVIDVPGVGAFVADLELRDSAGGRVLVELMGFWSREAVFRRVDLLARALPTPVLLVASERLRVDERALQAEHAALLVYKGVVAPRRLIAAAARLLAAASA